MAARQVFGDDIEIVPCKTFRQLFKVTEHDPSINGAVVAIENSIAGSILPNYRLLQESHLLVTGEVYLPKRQLTGLIKTYFELFGLKANLCR